MQLVLQQTFPLGRFHATPWRINPFDDPFGEWPPSPWRLARAVVARWYQWRREIGEIWPEEEINRLIEALCTSVYSFYLPAQARQSTILRQYQPVEFGWNPKSDKDPSVRSYSTSLVQDNAWCIPSDDPVFWFIDGNAWTPDLVKILDQCLQRIVYFGRAESMSKICRVNGAQAAANVTLSEHVSTGNSVPVLVPEPEATRADIERVTQDPKASRNIPQGARMLYTHRPSRPSARSIPRRRLAPPATNLIQFSLGWAVAPGPRVTARVTEHFRSAVIRNLIWIRTSDRTKRWSNTPADIRDSIATMTGKNSLGEPLQGPRQHTEFLLWWDRGLPTRLLVWRGAQLFDQDEQDAIYAAAGEELSWAATGPKAGEWRIKLVPLDTAVPRPDGFNGKAFLVWRSLTPYVPIRHHLRGSKIRDSETIENQVRRELSARGYALNTKLTSVEVSPAATWVVVHTPRRNSDKQSFNADRRGYTLRLEFEAPGIVGPLRLGHSSNFGLGLFAPPAG